MRYRDLPYQVSTTAGEGFNTVNLIVEQRATGFEWESALRPVFPLLLIVVWSLALHARTAGAPPPDDPSGYLRRGPGGEVPSTAIPGGSGTNFAWMLTAGIAMPLREDLHLDLGYRYTDAGEVRTDIGDIAIVRYRRDGTRRVVEVPINETSAEFRTHSLLATLRFEF